MGWTSEHRIKLILGASCGVVFSGILCHSVPQPVSISVAAGINHFKIFHFFVGLLDLFNTFGFPLLFKPCGDGIRDTFDERTYNGNDKGLH